MVLQYASCEPFQVAVTLASLASYIFRLSYINSKEIAILNDAHNLSDRSQSIRGACFMKWIQDTKYPDLMSINTEGGEKSFGCYKVDGYSKSNNIAVEYYG